MVDIKDFLGNHKKIVIAILAFIVLFIIAVFVLATKLTWDERAKNREFERKTKEFQAELERPYREDTHGGKTPEETWGLFLDALKKGDIDLASKYFVVDKQREMKNRFEESIRLNKLQSAIKDFSGELKKEKDYLQGEKAYFFIPMENTEGEVEAYPVVFHFNSYTEVWKIIVL